MSELSQKAPPPTACEMAAAKWQPLPNWVSVLAREVDRVGSRRIVGERLGYSTTTISQVISNQYRGDLKKLEDKVRGQLIGDSVSCPVAGLISLDLCRDYQARPFRSTSGFHTRLYRACRNGCPHSSLEGQGGRHAGR